MDTSNHRLEEDLGPLAWVLGEMRSAWAQAIESLRSFQRKVNDPAQVAQLADDAQELILAKNQFHQTCGALEMVGAFTPAFVLRNAEVAVTRFIANPSLCTSAAVDTLEQAGQAVAEYLESLLQGEASSALLLFLPYRNVHALAGSAYPASPADLWALEGALSEPDVQLPAKAIAPSNRVRNLLDQAILKIIKGSKSEAAAKDLVKLCLGLAAGNTDFHERTFWKVAAGFFEALAQGALKSDIYVKRAATRVLVQYASLIQGDVQITARWMQDLLFFCAQAQLDEKSNAPVLRAVRQAFRLNDHQAIDYSQNYFWNIPTKEKEALAQLLRNIADNWSSVSDENIAPLAQSHQLFSQLARTLPKYVPGSEDLTGTLVQIVDGLRNAAKAPSTELAMEVATSVLYLQAMLKSLGLRHTNTAERLEELNQRLQRVQETGHALAIEPWMEDLYSRVSDTNSMGSVVGELRATLTEVENSMDSFFREPSDAAILKSVPGLLSKIKGVLSILALDQAGLVIDRISQHCHDFIDHYDSDAEAVALDRHDPRFEKIGSNLGALGLQLDMLSYQPALAKDLFVYDAAEETLKPLMGRLKSYEIGDRNIFDFVKERHPLDASRIELDETYSDAADAMAQTPPELHVSEAPAKPHEAAPDLEPPPLPAEPNTPAAQSGPAASPVSDISESDDDEDQELLAIFLEEAQDVIDSAQAALTALRNAPEDNTQQVILRRALHTLKGSSRMVGLEEFGEAAWSMEQLLNAWLAEQKPFHAEILNLCAQALQKMDAWVTDIHLRDHGHWSAEPFRRSADAMRLEGRFVALDDNSSADPHGAAAASAGVELAQQDQPAAITATAIEFDQPADAMAEEAHSWPDSLTLEEEYPATSETPVDGVDADGLHEIKDFLKDLDHSVAQSAAEADRWGIEFSSTIIKSDDAEAEEPAPAPVQVDFSADQGLAEALASPDFGGSQTNARAVPGDVDAEPGISLDPDRIPTLSEEPSDEDAPGTSEQIEATDFGALGLNTDVFNLDLDLDSHQSTTVAPLDDATQVAPLEDAFTMVAPLESFQPEPSSVSDEGDAILITQQWAQELSENLNEWARQPDSAIPEAAIEHAQTLAEAVETIGLDQSLSKFLRRFEYALQHLMGQPPQVAHAQSDAMQEAMAEVLNALQAATRGSGRGAIDAAASNRLFEVLQAAQNENGSALPMDSADHAALSHEGGTDSHDAPQPPEPEAAQQQPADQAYASEDGADESAVIDHVDADLFPIFEEEAIDLLPRLVGSLRRWADNPAQSDARREALRVLHTLKGSSRLAGAMQLGEMAHTFESAIEALEPVPTENGAIQNLLTRYDRLQAAFDTLRSKTNAALAHGLLGNVSSASNLGNVARPKASGWSALAAGQESRPAGLEVQTGLPPSSEGEAENALLSPATDAPEYQDEEDLHWATPAEPSDLPGPTPLDIKPTPASRQTLRVRTQLINRLINQSGEIQISRARAESRLKQLSSSLKDMTANLERLRRQLRELEVQAESQMQSRLSFSKENTEFDPLEFDRFTRVQELTRMMAETVNDVATVQRSLQIAMSGTEDDLVEQERKGRELQRDLLRTRMVEFDSITERLFALVRQAASETGKQVQLDIQGGTIEVDRSLLDRMMPAFEHLLRNCVTHGIETPAERHAAGKPETGVVSIDVSQEGNDVSFLFRDDGKGLNLPAIRDKGIESGLIQADQSLSDTDIANLIFLPGFTTMQEVTGLAGRGIGMDVVRTELNAVGGRIETTTSQGQGSTFRLVMPLTTAATQVLLVRIGGVSVAIPANQVDNIHRLTLEQLDAAYASQTLLDGQEQVPFYWAGALLQYSTHSHETQDRTLPVVLIRSTSQTVALHVDEILGNQEVVVKNLGPQIATVPGLAGMSVLASSAVLLIYNFIALAKIHGAEAHALQARTVRGVVEAEAGSSVLEHSVFSQTSSSHLPLVLVVDDSITVRRVTQRMLKREGYRVELAADGVQAIQKLEQERPAVVLSDIEMPRMDGFELLRHIREQSQFAELPVIMITSRTAQKHKDHAMELGANHYLGKPYTDNELLSLVHQYAEIAQKQQEEKQGLSH